MKSFENSKLSLVYLCTKFWSCRLLLKNVIKPVLVMTLVLSQIYCKWNVNENKYLRFWCVPIKSTQQTVTFLVHRLMLLTAKTYLNFMRIDQFLCDLQPKQIFRQANFKLSHGNKINNGIQLKRRPLKIYKYIYIVVA